MGEPHRDTLMTLCSGCLRAFSLPPLLVHGLVVTCKSACTTHAPPRLEMGRLLCRCGPTYVRLTRVILKVTVGVMQEANSAWQCASCQSYERLHGVVPSRWRSLVLLVRIVF
jgi:hypothetical protein